VRLARCRFFAFHSTPASRAARKLLHSRPFVAIQSSQQPFNPQKRPFNGLRFRYLQSNAIVSHVRPSPPAQESRGGPTMVNPFIAIRSKLNLFVCYDCRLFWPSKKVISFIISNFHALCANHRGWRTSNESYPAATGRSLPSSIPFRMNTCRNISRKTALSPFKMNTCEKPRGEGAPAPAQAAP
jgi:hypothetical protein